MTEVAILLALLIVGVIGGLVLVSQQRERRRRELEDAKAEARRWVERLGGQVLNLTGIDVASQQAIADASERYNAAGSQLEQAQTTQQAKLVTATALEGLYYVRAARLAMDMDPGPSLPDDAERARAGKVTADREVEVEGHQYVASPRAGQATPHYYPGGRVAGRPVPEGWYSEPWWKPALVTGAWTMASVFMFSAMFSGMAGIPSAEAWQDGYNAAEEDAMESGDMGGDAGGDMGGGDAGGDFGGGFFDGGGFGGDFGGGF
ncbi:MAG: hypothetical protein GEU97_03270 [Actinophytocola sp.]|nr:hypothetical protein [Actinophytocola sp.]